MAFIIKTLDNDITNCSNLRQKTHFLDLRAKFILLKVSLPGKSVGGSNHPQHQITSK